MKRNLTNILMASALLLGVTPTTTRAGDVTVRSTPGGALATLSGEVTVSGITPVRFPHTLIGEYRLCIEKAGWEKYSTRVVLDPGRPTEISVRLARKTRLKAAVRSIIIPGWGQKYGDQKTKASILAALAVGSAVAFAITDADFDDKYDLFRRKLTEFDAARDAGNLTEVHRIKPELDAAQDQAYDAENVRRVTIGAVVAVWGISLLDVLFFFPGERGTVSVKGLTLKPSATPDGITLTLARGF